MRSPRKVGVELKGSWRPSLSPYCVLAFHSVTRFVPCHVSFRGTFRYVVLFVPWSVTAFEFSGCLLSLSLLAGSWRGVFGVTSPDSVDAELTSRCGRT